jgi:CheY-like chemotaxis protein
MVLDSLTQARQLFLAEALELCQQVKEGLLILAHAPTPLTYQKLVRRVQTLCQGAHSLELTDIELWANGLGALLEVHADFTGQASIVQDLLHHLCDGLQLSLITHSSTNDTDTALSQREFVLHSLMPKVLEVFEVVSTQTLPEQLQTRLLLQQIQWIQFWSQSLDLSELKAIADTTLRAFETFPQAMMAIAPVALVGFQVAYDATIQQVLTADSGFTALEQPTSQHPLCPSEQALDVFKTSQHLVGLAHQIIFCVATESIEEITVLEPSQLQHEDGRTQIFWRDRLLTLHQFTDLWQPFDASTLVQKEPKTSTLVLILRHESQTLAVALEVDRLIVEPELKLERPDEVLPRGCYGMVAMDEGSRVELVDVNALLWEPAFSLAQPEITTPKPKTILIVDDSKTVRELLALTLRDSGHCILQAQDGQQAIEHLERQANIHLILCDLEMSNLNGFDFLRHRLQNPSWIQIPVLILSSHTEDEYRQLSKKLGAADYFTIPYDQAELLQAIEGLLHQKQE